VTPGGAIAAVASAAGSSPRAIVRVSGSLEDFDALFTAPLPRVRSAFCAELRLGVHTTLPVLVALTVSPASYTGEDSLDIFIPGGPAIVSRVLRAITESQGVRHAEPGEFTARSFTNGRIDLTQAKGVAMTIAAASAEELRAAQRFTDSAHGARAEDWTQKLSTLLALVEAGIDFADQEDVVAIEPTKLAEELGSLTRLMREQITSGSGSEHAQGLPRVVLVGAPSAGKSTLFNALVGRERSVVHETPGTTRDAIAEEVTLPGGGRIELVDLAGLDGGAKGALDREIQRRAKAEIERADAAVLCDPLGVFDETLSLKIPTLRVRTKADQPIAKVSQAELEVCALDGWHLDELRTRIARLAGLTGIVAGGALASRIDTSLRRTCEHLARAELLARARPAPWELIAGEMRSALDSLGFVSGRVDPDEVLGLIFQTFCIGK